MSDSIITSSLPTGKNHISYSEYSDWARCSWKHRLKHVKKLGAADESPYLVFGSIVHDCCENILKSGSYNKDELVSYLEKNWLHDHPCRSRSRPSWRSRRYRSRCRDPCRRS